MAVTRGPYEAIDDSEVDAESPITESLMFRLRDQWQAALVQGDAAAAAAGDRLLLPAAAKTAETDVATTLSPDGSGGVQWTLPGEVERGSVSVDGAGANTWLATLSNNLITTAGTVYEIYFYGTNTNGSAGELAAGKFRISRYVGSSTVWKTEVVFCVDNSGTDIVGAGLTIGASSLTLTGANTAGSKTASFILRKL